MSKCQQECKCGRHACAPDCTCSRHGGKPKPRCQQGCTCGKHTRDPEVARRVGEALRGRPKDAAHRAALSKARMGRALTAEHREQISAGLARRTTWGEKSVASKHIWARRHLVKSPACQDCGREGYCEWASIGHSYTQDRTDWLWLCRSCHLKMDQPRGFCVKRTGA